MVEGAGTLLASTSGNCRLQSTADMPVKPPLAPQWQSSGSELPQH